MNKNLKKFVATLMVAGTITSIGATSAFADSKLDTTNLPGSISIKSTFGEEASSGYLLNNPLESEAGGKINFLVYGLPLLKGESDAKDNTEITEVEDFISWIKENNPKFTDIFTEGLKPGTEEFDTAWKKASELDQEEFALAQQNYTFEKKVKPVVEHIKEKYDIDLQKDRALEEITFSIVSMFGTEKSITLLENAIESEELTAKSKSKKIIDAIQEFRINQIEENEVMNDTIKKGLIKTIDKETEEFKEFINEESLIKEEVEDKNSDTKEKDTDKTTANVTLKAFLNSLFKK